MTETLRGQTIATSGRRWPHAVDSTYPFGLADDIERLHWWSSEAIARVSRENVG